MAGPKEEWFIWDGRFQFGFSCLNKRLEINEEAVQRILQLDHQTEQLAASSKQLQEDNGVLRDRIQQLEQASHQITQLDEQIQDLTASCTQLKEENNGLNDKILQLEQESSYQDQKNGLLQGKLKEKLSVQEEGLKSVFVAMEGMNETARAERGQRGEEIQHLRSQVEALAATRHTPGEHARDASRGISQTNTEDEAMLINPRAKHLQQPNAAQQDIEVLGVLIRAQAFSTPFETHLRYAEKIFKRYEIEAVQAFVSGLRESYRTPLENKLEEHGEWTWQAAIEEGYRMVAAEKKTRKRSMRLMAGSS